jgi:hypothetical protein
MYLPILKKIDLEYGWKVLEKGTTLLLETSSDLKWISNENSEKYL